MLRKLQRRLCPPTSKAESGNEIKALDVPAFSHGTDPSLCPGLCPVGAGWKQQRHPGGGWRMAAVCAGTGASWLLLTLAGWQEDVLDQLCG